jgi:hypothetical protein
MKTIHSGIEGSDLRVALAATWKGRVVHGMNGSDSRVVTAASRTQADRTFDPVLHLQTARRHTGRHRLRQNVDPRLKLSHRQW